MKMHRWILQHHCSFSILWDLRVIQGHACGHTFWSNHEHANEGVFPTQFENFQKERSERVRHKKVVRTLRFTKKQILLHELCIVIPIAASLKQNSRKKRQFSTSQWNRCIFEFPHAGSRAATRQILVGKTIRTV